MAPHSSTLAWKLLPWTEEPGRLQSMRSLRVRHDWATSLSRIGEENGNPLQCSCLENPRNGKPGGLPFMGSHRVGHDWSDLAAAAKLVMWQNASVHMNCDKKERIKGWDSVSGALVNTCVFWRGWLVVQLCLTLCDPMDYNIAYQAPLSIEFSWQEYWSGMTFPSLLVKMLIFKS